MNAFYNKHYITVRLDGVVTDCWSDGPHPENDITDAICINEQGGYQFRLYPDGKENPPIYDIDGIPLYKWDGEHVIPRTAEEIDDERAKIRKALASKLRVAEIKQQLITLDLQTTRPLRAIEAGTSTDEDKDKLSDIESQAVALREELVLLEGGD